MSAARLVNDSPFGEEIAFRVEESGCEVRTNSDGEGYLFGAEYVRTLAPDGTEIGYWDSVEWMTDPVCVMGAILASASGREIHPVDPQPDAGRQGC
jgi:hypothetical protein